MLSEIVNLGALKSCQDTDVPTKIKNANIFTDFIHPSVSIFFKAPECDTYFKKGSKNSEHNYRPIRILKNICKANKKVVSKQIGDFMEDFFSKFQCDLYELLLLNSMLIVSV